MNGDEVQNPRSLVGVKKDGSGEVAEWKFESGRSMNVEIWGWLIELKR